MFKWQIYISHASFSLKVKWGREEAARVHLWNSLWETLVLSALSHVWKTLYLIPLGIKTLCGFCQNVWYLEVSAAEKVEISELLALSTLVPLVPRCLSKRKQFFSEVCFSGVFLSLQRWPLALAIRWGGLIGGRNVKFLMGTTLLLGRWLCFQGLAGLFSGTEYFEDRWWSWESVSLSIPLSYIFSSSKRCVGFLCMALRKGHSAASVCWAAIAVWLQDPVCWFTDTNFLKLSRPAWDSQCCSVMLAELSPLEGTGSSDEGVPLSASLCFGLLYVFEVKSMQLRGTTLAQPQTCCKTKFFC